MGAEAAAAWRSHSAPISGVEDGFEPLLRAAVGERDVSHARAIQAAIGCDDRRPEGRLDRWHGGTLRQGHRACNGVGIDQRRASGDQQGGDGALAAADATCQTDAHGARLFRIRQTGESCPGRTAWP
jgi:hypothetical protein